MICTSPHMSDRATTPHNYIDASASCAFFMPTVLWWSGTGPLARGRFGIGGCSNLCQAAAQHYIKRQSP